MRLLLALLFIVIAIAPVRAADTCDAGYYLNDAGECEICPAGYYCPGDGNQNPCPENFTGGKSGATSMNECAASYVEPGYYLYMPGFGVCGGHPELCPPGYYCPGGYFDKNYGCNIGAHYGKNPCPKYTYNENTGQASVDACIQCPSIKLYQDSCDVSYGEIDCVISGEGAERNSVETCNQYGSNVTRFFATESGNFFVVTRHDSNGNIMGYTAGTYNQCNDGYIAFAKANLSDGAPGLDFNTVEEAIVGVCVNMDAIPDGTICGDLTGDGFVQCVPCADISPMFTHSDGTRTLPTDCYAISNPGYYIQTNMDTYEVYESECVPGDYCPGGIDVRYDMATDSFFGGNISCATLGDEYTMSDAGATSENMCYKICSVPENQPEIENGTVVSDSNAFYPNVCGYSIKCNDEYGLINNACYAVCNSGVSHMRTSVGNSFTLFAERVTSPSLNISYNNTVCYAPLSPGQSKNTININYNGQIYHLE